jgi:hypothetical protein
MVRIAAPVPGTRLGWMALGLVAGTLSATIMYAQQPPAQQPPAQQPPPAQQAQAAPTTRTFPSDAAMVLNFIKPDKTADFEAVIAKLKEALAKSEKPERKEQAKSWKVFKSPDPAQGGNVLYVFIVDPPVKDADYTISNILAEAFPQEVNDLYKKYGESYATGMNFVNLTLVADLGK